MSAAAAALLCGALAGCTPPIVRSAVVSGGLVTADRRTAGIQVEDEAIEQRARIRVRELTSLGNVHATSFNRVVLLTGEVPGAAEKAAVEQAVAVIEHVKAVVSRLAVGPNSSIGSRSVDVFLTGKVKATLTDAKDVQANAFRVVVDHAVVYMMGRVTEREATRAADLARSVPGVQEVTRLFELLTERELAALGTPAAGAAPASVPVGVPAPPAPPMPAPTPLPTK